MKIGKVTKNAINILLVIPMLIKVIKKVFGCNGEKCDDDDLDWLDQYTHNGDFHPRKSKNKTENNWDDD